MIFYGAVARALMMRNCSLVASDVSFHVVKKIEYKLSFVFMNFAYASRCELLCVFLANVRAKE